MNNYYFTLVLRPDLEQKEREALLGSLVKKLVADSGKIEKENLWGEKNLAYPIKRQNKGFVAHYEVTAECKNARTLDKMLKVEEDVLRYLLIRR